MYNTKTRFTIKKNLAIGIMFVHITNVSTKHFEHKYEELVEINVVMNSLYIMLTNTYIYHTF